MLLGLGWRPNRAWMQEAMEMRSLHEKMPYQPCDVMQPAWEHDTAEQENLSDSSQMSHTCVNTRVKQRAATLRLGCRHTQRRAALPPR